MQRSEFKSTLSEVFCQKGILCKLFTRPLLDLTWITEIRYVTIQETHFFHAKTWICPIIGCFWGTARDKLYSEVGLESLGDRWFYRKLIAFYKIFNKNAPKYLIDYLTTRDLGSINLRRYRTWPIWLTSYKRSMLHLPFIKEQNLD